MSVKWYKENIHVIYDKEVFIMLLLEDLKPLRVYNRPLFLPTVENDKKKKSAVFLLTPNYESSKALMTSNLLINKLRFASYYIEKDLTYFISSKVMDKVEDVTESYVRNFSESDFYQSLCEMSTAERNKLKDSDFGLPSQRKYPLHDKDHVLQAIKFFNYVDSKDEKELAKNINNALGKFCDSGEYPTVGKNNRFLKYYKNPVNGLHENIIRNVEDIYYNKDKFDSREINLCFITGLSGSGKSTMGYKLMDDDKKVETYELDDVIANWDFSDDNLKQYGDLIYSFFKGIGKKYRYTSKEDWLNDTEWDNRDEYKDGYEISAITDFVDYAIKYAKAHQNKKLVLEGVWIYHFIDPNKIKDYAVYIKGTSMMTSKYRAAKRDTGDAKTPKEKRLAFLNNFLRNNLRDYHQSETRVEKYRKYFSQRSVTEATVPTNIPKDIAKFSQRLNKEYKYGVVVNSKPVVNLNNFDFFKDYKSLSVSEFERYKTGVCWDFVHYEADWFRNTGYKWESYYIEVQDEDGDLPTHCFLTFTIPGSSKVYYFESSWGKYKGIEEFDSISSLLNTVKKRFLDDAKSKVKRDSIICVKYDASSKSLEHIGCADYYKAASKGQTMLTEACKDLSTARKFVWDVTQLAKKYNANFFIVTDGASGYSNGNGVNNPAVKNARNNQIEWEKKNGFDPDEDWSDTMHESVVLERGINRAESFYRVTYCGEGVYEAFKQRVNKETWIKFLDTCRWLPKPPESAYGTNILNYGSYTSYFTEEGIKKFKKENLPMMEKYLKPIIIEKLSYNQLDAAGERVYADKYQVVMGVTDFIPLYESYDITSERGFYHYDGTYNCIVNVTGVDKPLRGRGEILILDPTGTKIYLVFKDEDKMKKYKVPGGGFEPNESHLNATVREAKEEARIEVSAVYDTGVRYVEMFKDDVDETQKEFAPENRFYGFYTEVFIGTAVDTYDGEFDTVDVDEKMTKGKFYDIEEVYDKLTPEHKKALNAVLYESDVNFSDLTYYHLELARPGFNPKIAGGWDEELYSRSLDYAIKNDILSKGHRKSGEKCEAHVYTMGEEYSAVYLGKLSIRFFENDKFDWEWAETSDVSPAYIGYLKDEVWNEAIELWPDDIPTLATEKDITCSGYVDDLSVLRVVATPKVYNDILKCLRVGKVKLPKFNLIASDRSGVETFVEEDETTQIDIYFDTMPTLDAMVSEITFIEYVEICIAMYLIEYLYPNLKKTVFPWEFACDVVRGKSDDEDMHEFIKELYAMGSMNEVLTKLNNMNIDEMMNLVQTYGFKGKISKFDIVTESSKEITASSLTKSMKYKVSTKNKIAHGKLRNKASNLARDIKDKQVKVEPKEKKKDSPQVDLNESLLSALEEGNYIISGDYVTIFEDSTYDPILKKILYTERMMKKKEATLLLDRVKEDIPEIKYAYLDINRYQQKNLFVDLYYYQQAFFKNNTWQNRKGLGLYIEFLDRLINDKRITKAGYERKTVFISINDWFKNPQTRMWLFREDINPISIIYEMMMNDPNRLNKLFKGISVVFFGDNNYFTVDFTDVKNYKKNANKFKLFVSKVNNKEEFNDEEVDSSQNTPSKEAIKADIIDKIETTKGVDLTKASSEVKKGDGSEDVPNGTPNTSDPKKKDEDAVLKTIARGIDNVVDNAVDVDDALDKMDQEYDMKELLSGIDSMKDDAVNINVARAERMSQLDRELLDKTVKGRTVRDILSDDVSKEEIPASSLPVSSPNEEWQEMRYMNFDETYDMEKDVVNIFEFFSSVSRPLAIRNIKAENNSTSEDYLDLYTVEYEDYRGKRYTIKLDIPKIKKKRFMLRGNSKTIQAQFFNMPIIKTDEDTCQIVTNYKKIIISRFNTVAGRSLPNTGRFLKAASKYTGKKIKFTTGDNTRICAKYNLPVDYIDIASVYSNIETDSYIFYFNQDELRKKYEMDDSLGVPYAYSKKDKKILYYPNNTTIPFVTILLGNVVENPTKDNEFFELFKDAKPASRGMYSRARIMSSDIPLVIVCAYSEGLTQVLKKANVEYRLMDKLTTAQKNDLDHDYVKFNDGFIYYKVDYSSSMLLNGLKDCDTENHSYTEIDDKNMYLEFLDGFGGRIKADGLDNFYDCEIDPITKETLARYKLPTDYISVLLYANYLLCDNKYIKHTDTSSRRARRYELVAAYTYQVMSEAYGTYSNALKHNSNSAVFSCRQDAVINKILMDPTASDYSTINLLNDVETTNAITYKGLSGMNSDRSYSLDKRTYDPSMIGVVGMSTGFSGNVGITRQATLDMNIEGERGYVKDNKGKMDNMNSAKVLTATEAVMPFITTHDDPMRVAMSFIQTSKHAVRTEVSDPLLVTNGADEALPYIASDQFAYKAKDKGSIISLDENGMIVEYQDGTKDYIDLSNQIVKNSDGGFYISLKLDADEKLKVGSKFKPGQILAYDRLSISNSVGETDNLAYNVGKLAKIAIINSDEEFEDSGVISSFAARDLACRIISKVDIVLDKDTNIYSVAKVGNDIEQGDPLIVWQTPYEDEDVNSLLKALANDKEALEELGRHSVKSDVTGKIVGMKVYKTVEDSELSDSLRKLVKQYEKPIAELKKRLESEDIDASDLPANYPLSPTGKLKNAADGVLLEFYIEYLDIVGVGDKITYNAANKAVISRVIPEGKEPYTDFRPNEKIAAFVSVTSIQKRMVQSTITYGALQKLMIELDRYCKTQAGIPFDDSKV